MDTLNQQEKIAGGAFFNGTFLYNEVKCKITSYSVRNEHGEAFQVAVKKAIVSPSYNELAITLALGNEKRENFVYCYGGYSEECNWDKGYVMDHFSGEYNLVTESLPTCFIVMEYIPTDLHRMLLEMHSQALTFSPGNRGAILTGLSKGLLYMHQSGIIHSDIKSANILMQEYTPKFCDFGYSQNKTPYKRCGTPRYIAPEVSGHGCSEKTDIFSLGIVMLEIFKISTAKLLFMEKNEVHNFFPGIMSSGKGEAFCKLAKEKLSSTSQIDEAFSQISEALKAQVCACLSLRPADRPNAELLYERISFFTRSADRREATGLVFGPGL